MCLWRMRATRALLISSSSTSSISINGCRDISPEDLQAMRDALALLRSFELQKMSYPLPGAAAGTNGADGLHRLQGFPGRVGKAASFLVG